MAKIVTCDITKRDIISGSNAYYAISEFVIRDSDSRTEDILKKTVFVTENMLTPYNELEQLTNDALANYRTFLEENGVI